MWLLQRLHIVDWALTATSSSVPHSKQVSLRISTGRSGERAGGLRTSWTRMYWPHFLQAVEMATRGSGCWCPQRGQVTRTLSCFFAGIQCSPAPGAAAGQRPPILAGSGILGDSLVRGGGEVGETLFGLTSVFPTKVTPSSMTSLVARMSPNSSVLALMSIFSLALMLPLILPPLSHAVSPCVFTVASTVAVEALPYSVEVGSAFRSAPACWLLSVGPTPNPAPLAAGLRLLDPRKREQAPALL